jgi:hypothetical protein
VFTTGDQGCVCVFAEKNSVIAMADKCINLPLTSYQCSEMKRERMTDTVCLVLLNVLEFICLFGYLDTTCSVLGADGCTVSIETWQVVIKEVVCLFLFVCLFVCVFYNVVLTAAVK